MLGLPKAARCLAPWERKLEAVQIMCWTKSLTVPAGRTESLVLSQDLGLSSWCKNRKPENVERLTCTQASRSPRSCCMVGHCSLIAVSTVKLWGWMLWHRRTLMLLPRLTGCPKARNSTSTGPASLQVCLSQYGSIGNITSDFMNVSSLMFPAKHFWIQLIGILRENCAINKQTRSTLCHNGCFIRNITSTSLLLLK